MISFKLIPKELEIVKHQAEAKGLKLNAFAKFALIAYINQHPAKGVFTIINGKSSERC